MNWLDTETKAILQKEDESKLAPPKAAEFALLLIRKGIGHQRLVRAICQINECRESEAIELARLPAPVTILGIPLPGPKRRVSRFSVWVPFKKARIMKHWATRVGAQVRCDSLENASGGEDEL